MKQYTILIFGIIILSGVVVGGEAVSLSVDNAIDTQEQTVEIEGEEHDISEIGLYDPGEQITVTVTGPEDAIVQLRDGDRFIQDFERLSEEGTQQVTFETGDLEPGTYAVALDVDGTYEAVVPVVISGYDLSVTAPESATTDETITVSVEVEYEALSSPPEAVEIAVWNDDEVFDVTAEAIGNQIYEADIDLDGVPLDEYQVDATAVDDEEVNGFPNALAIGTGDSLTITESDDGEETDEDDTNGGDESEEDETDEEEHDGDDGDESDDGADEETDEEESDNGDEGDETDGEDETDEEDNGEDETDEEDSDDGETDVEDRDGDEGEDESDDGEADEEESDTADNGDETDEEESDSEGDGTADQSDEGDEGDDIIEPDEETDEETDSDDDGPGFGVSAAIVSLLVIGFFFHRRSA